MAAAEEQEENVLSADWIASNTKDCPKCGSHIQKDRGCNVSPLDLVLPV